MDALKIIVTLLLFAVLIFAIIKKGNIIVTLLALGLIGLACATAINMASLYDPSVTGNRWLDIAESFKTYVLNTFTNSGVGMMCIFGYSAYMKKIKAADCFASLCCRPLRRIKGQGALIAGTYVLTLIFLVILVSGVGTLSFMLAMVYPLLLALGVQPINAAIILTLGCDLVWGPTNPLYIMMNGLIGADINVTEQFIKYQLPVIIPVVILVAVLLIITSRREDKKAGWNPKDHISSLPELSEIGVPKFYALLPALPIVFMFGFSSFVTQGAITVSEVGACIMALVISALIEMIVRVKKGEAINDINEFFMGAGDALKGPVSIVICGTVFSAAITALGGFSIIMNHIVNSLGLSFVTVLFLIAILSFIIDFLVGNCTVPMMLFAPLIAESAQIAGRTDLLPVATILMCMAAMGMAFSPTRTNLLMINGQTGIELPKMMRRIAPIYIAAFLLVLIITFFVFV